MPRIFTSTLTNILTRMFIITTKLLILITHLLLMLSFFPVSLLISPLYLLHFPLCVRLTTAYSYAIWQLYRMAMHLTCTMHVTGSMASIAAGECVLAIGNHIGAIDFLVHHELAHRRGMLAHCKYVLKRSLGYVPVLGVGLHFLCFCFVDRQYGRDCHAIGQYVRTTRRYGIRQWLIVYPEGTRYTPRKKTCSDRFCAEKGMRTFEHVLCPRTKGFASLVQHGRDVYTHVLDVTVDYRDVHGRRCVPSLWWFFTFETGGTFLVDVRAVRMSEIADARLFVMDCFRRKDRLLSDWLEGHVVSV